MLLNLLSNACKYQVSGIIEVVVKCIQADETLTDSQIYLKISVNDEGVGMSAEKVKGIFEPFGSSSDKANAGGNGVGLSICKKICE